MNGIIIRRATAADAEALFTLENSVPEAAHWSLTEYIGILQAADETSALRRQIFVAEEHAALQGFIVVKLLHVDQETHAEIENLAVAPDARRRGVGSALCKAALQTSSQAHTLELEVRAGNSAAIALYTGLGFEQTGRRTGYYANPKEDAVLLQYKQRME